MISKVINRMLLATIVLLAVVGNGVPAAASILVDHTCTDITAIPREAIERAKTNLHIAYGHTSHGSQLTTGMTGLVGFANHGGLGLALPTDTFAWNNGGSDGALDLHDNAMDGDVGYYPDWVTNTRNYLDDSSHSDVNVIIWSWCGQVGGKYADGTLESQYLTPMTQLEAEYPSVTFVYMTGHVDIWDDANNKAANQAIRDYCSANNKVLYDFADIEHYDPDGTYYEYVDDNCGYYDGPGGTELGNWATEWQDRHTEGVDWYSCTSAHSQPLNANRKAYAAWWLWARLGGWDPQGTDNHSPILQSPGDQSVNEGETLQFTLRATDPDQDAIRFGSSALPEGAALDAGTGRFSWTPDFTQAGEYDNIIFSAIDDGEPPMTTSIFVDITVTENNRSPEPPAPVAPDSGAIDAPLSVTLIVEDGFFDPDAEDDHLRTRWQIGSDAQFDNPVCDLVSDRHLYSLDVPAAVLAASSTFFWRTQFIDNHGRASDWSSACSFTTMDNDSNQNGVPDDQEPGDSTVDLDGDGNPDVSQKDARCLTPASGDGAITLKAGSHVQAIQALTAIDPETISDTAYRPDRFPLGLIAFRIRTENKGDTVQVNVYSATPLEEEAVWYKYDFEGWQDYSANAAIAADRRSVTLTLEDGGIGDADGIANGVIVDPSGPGTSSSNEPTGSTDGSGGGGCFVNALLPSWAR